jgi:hypothetical protein
MPSGLIHGLENRENRIETNESYRENPFAISMLYQKNLDEIELAKTWSVDTLANRWLSICDG